MNNKVFGFIVRKQSTQIITLYHLSVADLGVYQRAKLNVTRQQAPLGQITTKAGIAALPVVNTGQTV